MYIIYKVRSKDIQKFAVCEAINKIKDKLRLIS